MDNHSALASVRFPIVSLGRSILAELIVERMTSLDDKDRFCICPDRREGLDILMDARAGDPAVRRLEGVAIRFLARDFTGVSFGLALALADKFVRFPPATGLPVIATGEIITGGFGRVGRIDGFEAKVQSVLNIAKDAASPLIFACPAINLDELAPASLGALQGAVAAGSLTLRPAKTLEDLSDLWRTPLDSAIGAVHRLRLLLAGAGLACVAAASLGGYTLWQAPVWACERAADALDSDPSANPSARIEAAVKSCDAIARARPHDGRLQFLAGQTHQLNGGDSLAQAYWLRAAKLQDIDGMTAWGEHLWRSAASDRAARTQARPWLEAAAKAGKPASVTAMQDLANLLSEGDATPADRQAAQGWDAQARKLGGSK